jgi:hypothetical protein
MAGGEISRELFDDAVRMLGGGIDFVCEPGKPSIRITTTPPRLQLAEGEHRVTLHLAGDDLRSTARTDAEHALVARMTGLISDSLDEERVRKANHVAELAKLPLHESAAFGRREVDALLGAVRRADSMDVPLGLVTARMTRGAWGRAARIELRREDRTVTLYLLDDELRTTARTAEDRALVEDAGPRVLPVVERLARERELEIDHAIATMPAVDRDTLVEAVTALTHGRVDAAAIADAILPATSDPRRYVAEHARTLRAYGVDAPVEGLHVVALLSHLPSAHLAYFDWKDSMHAMVAAIAEVLRAGPGVHLDVARYRARCDAWDRSRDRIPALRELAAEISGAALVELQQGGDAYAIACVPTAALPRLRAWKARAQVPLRSLVPVKAKAGAKELANATNVTPYAATARFGLGEIVEHPTFGRGKVVQVADTKVVVRFGDGERTLVHGKP